MRLPWECGKLFQLPQLDNLLLLCLVGAAELAKGYFAHEAIEEQLTESGLDNFVGKEIRPIEFKDFCFVSLLNMEQVECQAKLSQIPQETLRGWF